MDKYVTMLENSKVEAFGITDYFSFDSYVAVVEAYKRNFPEGKKFFIPNIEFRLSEAISRDRGHVHTHVLIDPTVAGKANRQKLMNDLETHRTHDTVRMRCSELSSTEHYQQVTVGITDLLNALAGVFPDRTNYIIVTAANNDGLRIVDTTSARSKSISDELDKASSAFFGSSGNTEYFLSATRYENKMPSEPKPVFSGSDAHSFSDLKRLSGDEANFEATWIKADLTFRGLRQTLFEPKERVHLGEPPVVFKRQEQDATHFINSLCIDQVPGYLEKNGSWFKNVVIPLNPELTAIIGNKGSGKSAIADILGLLGESRQFEHFSFLTNRPRSRKFRQRGYAENFNGTLKWESGVESTRRLDQDVDLLKPETVKYLPQHYFESLTNEIEVTAFRREIEEVVFSHVEESERMGTSSFSDLEKLKTAQSKSDIHLLKGSMNSLNMEIIRLERQAESSTKDSLTEMLKQKQEELKALRSSTPTRVQMPHGKSQEQRKISEQIDKLRDDQEEVVKRGRHFVELLSSFKSDLVKLADIKESVSRIDFRLKEGREELRENCVSLGLNIDTIIEHRINTTEIDVKIQQTKTEITKIEGDSNTPVPDVSDATDLSSLGSLPELRNAHRFISQQLAVLQETLTAPQRRYLRYVQEMAELSSKMEIIIGDNANPQPGTIRDIENRIHFIENELKAKLDNVYAKRDQVARWIFEAKQKVHAFFDGLKSSVEKLVGAVRSEEFDVTIDVSFVPSHEFSGQLLNHINQVSSGPFQGLSHGAAEFKERMAEIDWNDVNTIIKFANDIIEDIHKHEVNKQVKDIVEFYDLLFSFDYFEARYELRLGGKNLNQLSPGERGLLLLVFHLHLDKEKMPLIIDQPEDNLDNESIYNVLARCIREAKKTRQVILVTHNPNLAVGADAEQVIHVSLDKASNYKFSYMSGSIEHTDINNLIVKILEGSKPAFVQRRLKYQIN